MIFVDFCWNFPGFWLIFCYVDPDPFHWSGSGSGWPKWNGSKRIRIRNTAFLGLSNFPLNFFWDTLVYIDHSPKSIVETSVTDPDPYGSVSFWSAGSRSASMKRIRIRIAKNHPKSWKTNTKITRISYIFFLNQWYFALFRSKQEKTCNLFTKSLFLITIHS